MEYEISNFGWEIRRLRRKYNFTHEMLAHEVDVSVHYITQLENGKVTPSEEMRQALSDAIERFNPDTPLDLLIDYCRIRFPTTDVKFVVERILGLRMNLFGFQEHSFWGYSGQYFRGDIVVMVSEKDELGVMLELKGKGCRQFESYLNAQKKDGVPRGWLNFLRDCLNADAKMKRLDLAVNDKSGILNIPYFIEKMRKEEYKSIFHSFKEYASGSFMNLHEDEDKKLVMGRTLYIGSMRSDIYFCLYEKDYEQFMKEYQNNIINGYTIEDMEVKNRFEIRLKNDRAEHAVVDLVSNEEPEETVFGIINRYLVYLERNDKKDRDDWDLDKRWAFFIGEHRGKLKLTTKPEPYTLERTLNWVGKQVAPTLKMLIEYDNISGTQLLGTMIDNARLSDNQKKILEQQALSVDDMIVDSFRG